MSTGMPAGIWLGKFGAIVADYFGDIPYHVGSSLRSKDWRDVDVRLILTDAEFELRFGKGASAETHPKLGAITLAFCALGKAMTGLPIDFQIQSMSHANGEYGDQMRSALFEVRTPEAAATDELTAHDQTIGIYDDVEQRHHCGCGRALPCRHCPEETT